MMLLKNAKDVDSLVKAIDKCHGEVFLCSADKTEEFNMKSILSRYIAIGELCKDHGDEYELFCGNHDDERYLIQFFHDLREDDRKVKKYA